MPTMPDLPKAEAAIIQQANVFRGENMLQLVKSDAGLTKAAREYARFLAASTLFTHEADGRRPIDRAKAAGYKPCTVAENLAALGRRTGFETTELAGMMVEGWKNSPGHRKNMLLSPVTETGVAIVKVRNTEKYIGVQLFGRPQSLQYRFEIDNQSGRAVSYSFAGEVVKIEPRMLTRHTACEPYAIAFETLPGAMATKAATAQYEARDGQVYRLRAGKGGEIVIEVGAK